MTRRAVGSNQYKARISSDVINKHIPDLVQQATGASQRRRCGEVWGTHCQAWVQPPDYSHGDHGMRGDTRIAIMGCVDPVVLRCLAGSGLPEIRGLVSVNPHCPPQVLELLAQDEEWWVRESVAHHPNTPEPVLERLSQDKDQDVRWMVALNPNAPEPILEHLSQDESAIVRREVARNPNTTGSVLVQLAGDRDPGVRMVALDNPSLPEEYRILNPLTQGEYDTQAWSWIKPV
jgi:hypothetical protein